MRTAARAHATHAPAAEVEAHGEDRPRPRGVTAARPTHGAAHAGPHAGGSGFHDAINAGLHHPPDAMIGAVVGRVMVSSATPTRHSRSGSRPCARAS